MKTKSKLREKVEKVFIDNCEDEDDLLEDDKFVTHTAKITIDEILQAFSEELDELAGKAVMLLSSKDLIEAVPLDAIKEMKDRLK